MQTIKMDFQSQSTPPVVPVMQSDSQSRFIGLTLYDGGVPYSAPSGAVYTVEYHGQGANNIGWYDTIQLSSGTRKAVVVSSSSPNVVTLELAEQALRVNGEVKISLCVVNNTGYKLNTFPIICRVTGAPYVDPVSVRSYFYVTGLTSEQWMAYVTACQDAQKRAEDAAAKFVTDPTLSVSGKAADAAKVGEAVNAEAERAKGWESHIKEGLTKISEQKAYMDGVTNLFNWIRGGYTVVSNRLVFNADNEYAISIPVAVNVNNARYIKISDFETYKYALAITYNSDNWYYLDDSSNPLEIPKNVTGLVIWVARRDNAKITDSDLTSVSCTIISDSEFKHFVALTELFSMPKMIKSLIENTQTNTAADAFLLNENISMDTNNAKGLFSKKIGGIGSIAFTDWLPSEQLSNTFNVQQDDDYIYKCMHFPHDGTYPNLQYQDPNIIDVESLPFKLPIGAIYVNTDVAEEFNGFIRIVACNLFGYKKGYWYEIDNRNIKWAQIYSLPWGTSNGKNIPITYQDGTAFINLTNNKLTKHNVLHFGTANTYATEFDYYIVKVTVMCNKDSCGLKVGVDSRDNISGSPTQIVESRTFALTADTTLTAFAHNIPDSVYSRVITNFDNYVRLKVPHYYCGRVQINGFIINLLKDKKSVTTIKDLDSGEEVKVIINDGSVDTSSNNNLIIVTERYSRIEVTAQKDIFLNVIVSDTDAIENYNFDLI